MKVISIVNQKGGVGKTVSSVNIAAGLANQGKRVLAIDLDPQGSLSVSLGIDEPDKLDATIYNIMTNIINDIDFSSTYAIQRHQENIDFIPSNLQLAGLEIQLISILSRENILTQYIELIKCNYDVVLIDCSPSLGMLTINALACSDEVIIPVQAHYLSIKGMEQLFNTIKKIKRQINPNLEIGGILITMVDHRTNYAKDTIEFLHKTYGNTIKIFDTVIPMSIKAAEMSIEGKSIYQYDPKGKVAIAYKKAVDEITLSL